MEDVKNNVKEEYLKGTKQKDICAKYNISINTLKSWIKRYKWSEEKRNRGAPKNKKGAPFDIDKKNAEKQVVNYEVESVLENTELTERQRLFCIYYIEDFNATKAYQKAYKCDYTTANSHGYKLLSNVVIKQEIDRLTEECLQEQEINSKLLNKRLFQKYMNIAFSDITDFLEFNSEKVEGEFGPYLKNSVALKDSTQLDGSLISEISEGKDGVKVKLLDKMKALDWLDKHIGLASEEQKLKIDKLRAEVGKINNKEDNDITIKVVRASEQNGT